MYPGQSTLTVVLVAAEGGSQANYSYSAQTTTQVPVTLAVNQYGVLTITPQAGYSGTFGVTASVDGSSETFNVHVLANTPPTLPTIANQSTPINTPLTLTLAATDPDEGGNSPAGQTLTYSAAIVGSSPPVTLGIVLNQLTITPATGYEGTFTVQASVTDGFATIMKSFQVSFGGKHGELCRCGHVDEGQLDRRLRQARIQRAGQHRAQSRQCDRHAGGSAALHLGDPSSHGYAGA